jgi:hypothetical protein
MLFCCYVVFGGATGYRAFRWRFSFTFYLGSIETAKYGAMTSMMLLAVVVLCLALLSDFAVVVRATEPVAASTGDVATNSFPDDYFNEHQSSFRENLTSSYKYVTLHHHRGHNCTREIRFNVTFQLDACINGTYPWYGFGFAPRARQTINSFSFYYNSNNNTGYSYDDDNWMQQDIIYMISYYDDACTPVNNSNADDSMGSMEPLNCERGFSYSVSNE